MPPRHPFARTLGAILTVACVLPSVLLGAPAAAAPPFTAEERAYAIAAPSLVFLEKRTTGFLRRKDSGETLHTNQMVVVYRCTGFVVSEAGHVVSSAHCVQPPADGVRNSAINQLAADRIKVGQLTTDQRDAFVKEMQNTADFTGDQAGSKPSAKIYGQLFQGQSSLTTEPAQPVEVVGSSSATEGSVTLLKLSQPGPPVAELSTEPVNPSAQYVLLGFGAESGSAMHTTRYKSARINGRAGSTTPPLYLLDGNLGGTSHGGMVVDLSGRVIGMLNTDFSGKERLHRLVTPLEFVNALMSKSSVGNSLSATDTAYRSGLNDYFGGRYADAIKKLDSVIAVMPDHAIAKVYRKQAADLLAVEGDGTASIWGAGWLIYAVIGLGAALLIAIGVIIWIAARRRAASALLANSYAPISALPMSAQPISSYPVSGGSYPVSGGGATYDYLSTFRGDGSTQHQDSVYLPPPVPAETGTTEQPPGGTPNPWENPPGNPSAPTGR